MARDGSGTYSLAATMAVANQQANSSTVNSIMDDIAQALTDSINKDGSKAFEAAQSMGGYKLTNLAVATSAADAARLSQVQAGNAAQATAVTGTVDAIALAFTPAITAYATGMRIRWTSGGANTVTTPTINIDSLGAKTIKKNPGGAALAAGDLGVSGTINEAVYNGTDFILLGAPLSSNPSFTTIELGHASDTTLSRIAAGRMALEGQEIAPNIGQQTIWVPAGAMTSRSTNGAASGSVETSTNKVMLRSLDFDTTTQEFAQFAVQMPKGWNESTLICQFVWSHAATTVNFGVAWAIEAVAFANDDAADTAFGTAVQVTDTGGTTNDIYISDETGALTVAGSPGAEEWVVFQIKRVPADAADTMAVDARLHGVKIHYTIDAAKDD